MINIVPISMPVGEYGASQSCKCSFHSNFSSFEEKERKITKRRHFVTLVLKSIYLYGGSQLLNF
jgi:hypothetical protein